MKDRITLTLDIDIVEKIDKEMLKHHMRNKSQFIEFILRKVLFSPKQRLQLLEHQRDTLLNKFKLVNDDVLKLQEHCDLLDKAANVLTTKEEPEEKETDILNAWI